MVIRAQYGKNQSNSMVKLIKPLASEFKKLNNNTHKLRVKNKVCYNIITIFTAL